MRSHFLAKLISAILCSVFVLNLASCGTLIYPERRGQKSGQFDIGVVLMDAIGLFFFIVPGLLAFAVDFSTGAIYLPPANDNSTNEKSEGFKKDQPVRFIRVDPKQLKPDMISRIILEQTGASIQLNDPNIIISKADGLSSIFTHLEDLRN